MIDKIYNNMPLQGTSSKLPNTKKVSNNDALNVSINTDYSSLVEMAKKSLQTEESVIEKARESIRTGELESMANIQKAAENIFTFGI